MKGISETEIEESEKILTELNSNILEVIKFNLPIEGSNRSLIIVEKEKETDKKYPRSYDKIMKNK